VSAVAAHGARGERGQADRHVLGAVPARGAGQARAGEAAWSFGAICHDGRVNTPPVVRVRPARTADQAALTELDAISWSADSGFPSVAGLKGGTFFTAENLPEDHLVAELDGRVVGYIRLKPPTRLPENAHVIQVQGIAVHPGARRHGAGASLLDAAEKQLRERGIRKLSLRVLSTNQVAIRLYERQGFTREGTLLDEFWINGRYVDDVMMAKQL
jgi:ribosomal protein S18 acetylase RimI-like enzyme